MFLSPSAGIIMSLPSSMADFVPFDRLLQKAYCAAANPMVKETTEINIVLVARG